MALAQARRPQGFNLIMPRHLRYLGLAGIDPALALSFALLAFSTFV
jgi:hypothetical protein